MAVKTAAVTIGTTATLLSAGADEPDRLESSGVARRVIVTNGATAAFLGGSTVTTANGLPIAANAQSPVFELAEGESLYGIVASGTSAAKVLQMGVD